MWLWAFGGASLTMKKLKTRSSQHPDLNMVPIFSALMAPPFPHAFPLLCRPCCHRFSLLLAPGLLLLTSGSVWDSTAPLFLQCHASLIAMREGGRERRNRLHSPQGCLSPGLRPCGQAGRHPTRGQKSWFVCICLCPPSKLCGLE